MFEKNYEFKWSDIGDIQLGRPNLGSTTEVAVYRLLQYTWRAVLIEEYGPEKATELIRKAGRLAGVHFAKTLLNLNLPFNEFIANLKEKLIELKIGVLNFEKTDFENMHFILTVAEDLDCSGLPVTNNTVCAYDEGFIEGIFSSYTKNNYKAVEVDCWATGDVVCRFEVNRVKSNE